MFYLSKYSFLKGVSCIFLFFIVVSCTTVRNVGEVNMISKRNIDPRFNYKLLGRYVGGSKSDFKQAKKDKVSNIHTAVGKTVKRFPGGEFLKNVKFYLVHTRFPFGIQTFLLCRRR